jgi:urease accessory protein
VRRRLLTLQHGDEVMLDFPATITLADRDRLELSDRRTVEVIAAEEPLLDVRGRDATHLARLAWHIGNRHAPAEIGPDRILIGRDPTLAAMLRGLGAALTEVTEPFSPEPGAYAHGHGAEPHALLNR